MRDFSLLVMALGLPSLLAWLVLRRQPVSLPRVVPALGFIAGFFLWFLFCWSEAPPGPRWMWIPAAVLYSGLAASVVGAALGFVAWLLSRLGNALRR